MMTHVLSMMQASNPPSPLYPHVPSSNSCIPTHNDRSPPPLHVAAATPYTTPLPPMCCRCCHLHVAAAAAYMLPPLPPMCCRQRHLCVAATATYVPSPPPLCATTARLTPGCHHHPLRPLGTGRDTSQHWWCNTSETQEKSTFSKSMKVNPCKEYASVLKPESASFHHFLGCTV